MKKHLLFFPLNLHQFDEGAAAGAAGAAASAGSEGAGQEGAGEGTASMGISNPGQEGAGSEGSVSQDPTKQGGSAQPQPERLSFKDLLKQDEEYNREAQKMIQGRLRNISREKDNLQQQLNQANNCMNFLYARYGVQNGDYAGLQAALQKDTSYLEAEADMRGMTVEQLQYEKQLIYQNQQLMEQQRYYQDQMRIEAQQRQWREEEAEINKEFPGLNFSFENEIASSPQFEDLIRSGVPMKYAFQEVHAEEIRKAREDAAIEAYKRQTAQSQKAGTNRPSEAGAKSTTPLPLKKDFSKMSDEQILEMAEKLGH